MNKLAVFSICLILSCYLSAQSNVKNFPDFNYAGQKIEQNDQGFLIHTQAEDEAFALIQVDEEGNFLSSKTYFEGSANLHYANDFFYETGGVGDTLDQDVVIRKYDENGTLVFEKTIEKPLDNYGLKIITTQDGGIAVAGATQIVGDSLHRIVLSKFDASGNLLWQSITPKDITFHDYVFGAYLSYPVDFFYYKKPGIKQFQELPDGGFILNNCSGSFTPSKRYYDNLIRFDHQGKILWNDFNGTAGKKIPIPIPSVDFDINCTTGIDGYADGSVVIIYNEQHGTQAYTHAYIKKFDRDGNVIWQRSRLSSDWQNASGVAVKAADDGSAWWVVYDLKSWGLTFSGPQFYNKGVGVYHIAAEPMESTTNEGFPKAQFLEAKVYSADPIYGSYTYGTKQGIRPFSIIPLSSTSYVMTGFWGYYSYYYDYFDSNYYEDDPNSSTISPFFIHEELEGQCSTTTDDAIFSFGEFDGHQYFISKGTYSYEEAQTIAAEHGGYLLTINSQAENDFIEAKFEYGASIWLGLSDAQLEGEFVWENGEAITYTNWEDCQSEDCLNSEALDQVGFNINNGEWHFIENDQERSFIIEIDCEGTYESRADLRLDSLTIDNTNGYTLYNVPYNFEINYYNEGSLDASNVLVKAYLSKDAYLDEDDPTILEHSISQIEANTNGKIALPITILNTIDFGNYILFVEIDANDVIDELNEENNIRIQGSTTYFPVKISPPEVDLSIVEILNSEQITQGEEVSFSLTLDNQGNSTTQSYAINFYLIPDLFTLPYFNETDFLAEQDNIFLHSEDISETPLGISEPIEVSFLMPENIQVGDYHILAIIDADDSIEELDETNNVGYSEFQHEIVEVIGDYGVDLICQITSNISDNQQQEGIVPISFQVSNNGTAATNLVADDGTSTLAVKIGIKSTTASFIDYTQTVIIDNLDSGASISLSTDYQIPEDKVGGQYVLVATVDPDNEVYEFDDYYNNRAYSTYFTLPDLPPNLQPDITISNITNVPTEAQQGEVLYYNFDLNNIGDALAEGNYEIGMYLHDYFSINYANLSDAIEVGIVPTGNTPIGTIPNVGGAITVPADIVPGNYYLIIYADHKDELSERLEYNNNAGFSTPITITSPFEQSLNCPEDLFIHLPYTETSIPINWEETGFSITDNCGVDVVDDFIYQNAGLLNGSHFEAGNCVIEYGATATCNNATIISNCTFVVSVATVFQEETVAIQLCEGEEYNGTFYTENTSLVDTISSAEFDLIRTTTIQVFPSFVEQMNVSLCEGESYSFAGNEYTESGIYEHIYSTLQGCDSVVQLNLVVLDAQGVLIQETTCDQSEVGTFETTYTSQNGCDSVVVVEVSLLASDETYLTATTCDENEAGIFETVYTNQNGCDSIVSIEISLLPTDETYLTQNTCDENEVGTFITSYANQYGCDSVVTLEVNLLPSNEIYLDITTCEEEEAGTFVHTYINEFGCDSVVTTAVALLDSYITMSQDTVDVGTYIDDVLITTDTVFGVNLLAENGCDSTHFYQITVLSTNTNQIESLDFEYTLFPNPTQSTCTLQFQSSKKEELQLILYNTLGQVVQTHSIVLSVGQTNYPLDLNHLSKGIYLVQLQSESGHLSEKLMIQ